MTDFIYINSDKYNHEYAPTLLSDLKKLRYVHETMEKSEDRLRVDFLITSLEYLQMILQTHRSITMAFDLDYRAEYSKEAELFTETGVSMVGVLKMLDWIDSLIGKIQTHSILLNPILAASVAEKHHLRKIPDDEIERQEFNMSRQIP